MATWISASWMLGVGLLLTLDIRAAAIDDETRIEALVRTERAIAAAEVPAPAGADLAASAVVTVPPPALVIAESVRPAPSAVSRRDSSVAPPEPAGGLPFSDLARHIGDRVAVVTAGARVHRGVVKAVDAEQMTLQVRSPGIGGAAAYTLRREQIVRIDLR